MDETALIADAKKGDVQAYNRLVIHYQELAYNVARRIVGSPQAAEDITQESFIAAYQALNRFRGGSFKSWLLRIVTNTCYDHLRRQKRRASISLDELLEQAGGRGERLSENRLAGANPGVMVASQRLH